MSFTKDKLDKFNHANKKIDNLRNQAKRLSREIKFIEKRDSKLVEALARFGPAIAETNNRFIERMLFVSSNPARRQKYLNNESKTGLNYYEQLSIIGREDEDFSGYYEFERALEHLIKFQDPLNNHLHTILQNREIRFYDYKTIYHIFKGVLNRAMLKEEYNGYLDGELSIGKERIHGYLPSDQVGRPIYINKSWTDPKDAAVMRE